MAVNYRNLPDVLLAALYSEWLTVFDIARLDSATCNRQQRQCFTALAYISCRSLQYPSEIQGDAILDAMSVWICQKDVPVTGLFLTPTLVLNEKLRVNYLKRRGERLEWITYKQLVEKSSRANPRDSALGVDTYCPDLTRFRAINWDGGAAVTKIIKSCQHLTELRLKGEITNKQIQDLVGECTNLRKLTIHAMQNRHDGVFNALISSCPHLEEVNFRMQGYLSDALVDKIMRRCPELTVLALNNALISVCTLYSLLQNCKNLRSLSLEQSELYEDTTLAVFRSNLTDLHFDTVTVSDVDMFSILQCCPALRNLTLQRTLLASWTFMCIGSHCRQLQRLDISQSAAAVDDDVLRSIGEYCAQLRVLDVAANTAVTDAGVCALVLACALLEELILPAGSAGITDASLLAIAQNCRGMKRLALDSNKHITDAGVTAVLQECAVLWHVSFHRCAVLSKELEAQLRLRAGARKLH